MKPSFGHALPDYAQNGAAHGVLSSLSVPLPFQGITIGALNTYAGQPKVSTTVMLSTPDQQRSCAPS